MQKKKKKNAIWRSRTTTISIWYSLSLTVINLIFCHVTFTFVNSMIFAKLPGLCFFVFLFEVRQSEHVQLGRVEFFTFVHTEQ